MKRKLFFVLFCILISSPVISQLDSATVNVYYAYSNYPTEEDSITLKVIRTETWVNDFDFFGEIIITAYETETNYPIQRLKYNQESIHLNSLYNNGLITIDLYHGVEEGRNYRVDVLVRDYQGMNYPIISKTVN